MSMNSSTLRPWKGAGYAFSRPQFTNAQCSLCHNLFLAVMDPSSPKQPQGSTPESSRLRLDVFDLAESADSGDCLWCALIYRSLIGLGAELPEPGTIGTAAIVARQGKPFYVEWATMQERIAAEIYQPVGQFVKWHWPNFRSNTQEVRRLSLNLERLPTLDQISNLKKSSKRLEVGSNAAMKDTTYAR